MKVVKELKLVGEIAMGNAVYRTPIVANGVLFITNKKLPVRDQRRGE